MKHKNLIVYLTLSLLALFALLAFSLLIYTFTDTCFAVKAAYESSYDLSRYWYTFTTFYQQLFSLIFSGLGFLISCAAIVGYTIYQRRVNFAENEAKLDAYKQARAAAKQAREEEAKQKRIEELQAELNALNNSEKAD